MPQCDRCRRPSESPVGGVIRFEMCVYTLGGGRGGANMSEVASLNDSLCPTCAKIVCDALLEVYGRRSLKLRKHRR